MACVRPDLPHFPLAFTALDEEDCALDGAMGGEGDRRGMHDRMGAMLCQKKTLKTLQIFSENTQDEENEIN